MTEVAEETTTGVDIAAFAGHVDLLRHARSEIAKWTPVEKAAKSAIVEALGGATEGAIEGRVVVTRKEITTNRFDGKEFRKQYPDVAEAFTNASVSTRIELAE